MLQSAFIHTRMVIILILVIMSGAMSDYLLQDRHLNQSQRQGNSLAMRIRMALERKFDAVFRILFMDREMEPPDRTQRRRKHAGGGTPPVPGYQSTDGTRLFQHDIVFVKTRCAGTQTDGEPEWSATPLIKAPQASVSASFGKANKPGGNQAGPCLAGLCILCVGGRAALYPAYRHFVEATGGHFLIYRGDRHGGPDPLGALLLRADAVICPVDCVNHAAFFHVKRYCACLGKPCVLLERSGLPTFRRGIEILAMASFQNMPAVRATTQC